MKNLNYICHTDLAITEYNDCTVRALAHTLTGDYELAHDTCSQYGRSPSRGMQRWAITHEMLPALGFERLTPEELVNPNNSRKGNFTAESFIKAHVGANTGYNYYLIVDGHAIGIDNEGISDSSNFSGRKRIISAFKIKK